VGIDELGHREVLGIVATPVGSTQLWELLLSTLAERGVRSPRLVVGEADRAMSAAVERRWDGCAVLVPLSELERKILSGVTLADLHWAEAGLAELKACGSRPDSERIGLKLAERLRSSGYAGLATELGTGIPRYFAYFDFPKAHRRQLCSGRLVWAELKRVREQARILGPLKDDKVVVLLAAASFRRQCRTSWNAKPVLSFG